MLILCLILLLMGLLLFFMPEKCVRADRRDDPAAIEQIKKTGVAMMGFAATAFLLSLKYRG